MYRFFVIPFSICFKVSLYYTLVIINIGTNSCCIYLCTPLSLVMHKGYNEISNNVVFATSKASDQPAHMHSLIRAFACLLNNL